MLGWLRLLLLLSLLLLTSFRSVLVFHGSRWNQSLASCTDARWWWEPGQVLMVLLGPSGVGQDGKLFGLAAKDGRSQRVGGWGGFSWRAKDPSLSWTALNYYYTYIFFILILNFIDIAGVHSNTDLDTTRLLLQRRRYQWHLRQLAATSSFVPELKVPTWTGPWTHHGCAGFIDFLVLYSDCHLSVAVQQDDTQIQTPQDKIPAEEIIVTHGVLTTTLASSC